MDETEIWENVKVEIKSEPEDEPSCLICLSFCSSQTVVECDLSSTQDPNEVSVKDHLFTIFFLRNLLHYPSKECEYLLRNGGQNPGEWCSICGSCTELVHSGFKTYRHILQLEQRLEKVREELRLKLKLSFDYEGDSGMMEDDSRIIRKYFQSQLSGLLLPSLPPQKKKRGLFPRKAEGQPDYKLFNENLIQKNKKQRIVKGSNARKSKSIKKSPAQKRKVKNKGKEGNKKHRLLDNPLELAGPLEDFDDPLFLPAEDEMPYADDSSDAFSIKTTEERRSSKRIIGADPEDIKEIRGTLTFAAVIDKLKGEASQPKLATIKSQVVKPNTTFIVTGNERSEPVIKMKNVPGKRIYKCNECPFSSKVYSTCYAHSKTHFIKEVVNVDKAREETSCTSDVPPRNLTFRHRSRPAKFFCKICHHAFINQRSYKGHLKLHKTSNTTCTICNYPFKSETQLKGHKAKYHKSDIHRCDKCDFQTNKHSTYTYHVNSHSEGSSSVTTGEATKSDTTSHSGIPENKKSLIKLRTVKPFPCDICSCTFKNQMLVKRHKRLHIKYKATQCPTCHYPCNSDKILKYHIDRHNGIKWTRAVVTYKCEQCDFTTESHTTHKRHLQRHKICEYIDETDLYLKREGKVRCKQCGEVANRFKIHQHMKEVHGLGELSLCHYCHKTFASRISLSSHIRHIHEKRSLYKCEKCEKAFMFRHRFEAHKVKCLLGLKGSMICESCGSIFACLDTLRVHTKKFHPEVWFASQGIEMQKGTGLITITENVECGGKQ